MKSALLALVALLFSCSPTTVAEVNSVFNDVDTACTAEVLATSVIPPGTSPGLVAGDIAVACGIAEMFIPDLEKVVAMFETQNPTTATTYAPSPLALKKHAEKVRAFGDGK